jgi:hypothetical protein
MVAFDSRLTTLAGPAGVRRLRMIAICAAAVLGSACAANAQIHELVRCNDVPAVEALLEQAGTQVVNTAVGSGVTPLHLSAAMNHATMTSLLVSNGADINARTQGGFTPLHWAASRDASDAAGLLIGMGADINAVAERGITPLHWAADRRATNVVRLLVRAGAGIDPSTESGLTPLHWAVRHNAEDIATLLAYKAVSDDMDDELAGLILMVASNAKPAYLQAPSFPNPSPPPAFRDAPLRLDIGQGEFIDCAWIPSLNLWSGKYEITNGQYRRFKPSHDSMFFEGLTLNGTNQPVVYISWQDAQRFCEWVNQIAAVQLPPGAECRLPTCYEWIELARCGTDRDFAWGNAWPPAYGNLADTTLQSLFPESQFIEDYTDGFPVTCDVTQSGTNEWGLYGMCGNVWEWCQDSLLDGSRYRMRCGGGWDFDSQPTLYLETPGFDRATAAYDTIGFRIVVAIKSIPIANPSP